MKLGLRARLSVAQALLGGALFSLAGLMLTIERRENAIRESLILANHSRVAEEAGLLCRRYIKALQAGPGADAPAASLGAEAQRRVGRSWASARGVDGEPRTRAIERISRLVRASKRLLGRIDGLEREGRLREAEELRRKGMRPLLDRELGPDVDRWLGEESASRLRALQRAQRWTRLSVLAAYAAAALCLFAFWLWTQRLASYLVRNAERLRASMAAIGTGMRGAPLRPEGEDEMGELVRSLNDMAERLDRAQRHMLAAERASAFGQLARGAVQSAQPSLSTVIGYLDVMLQRGSLGTEDRQDLKVVFEEARKCQAVLRNLRQFTSPRAVAREPTQVNDVLRRLAEFLAPDFNSSGVTLSLALESRLPSLTTDRRELQQALFNLLLNARQATRGRPGGRVCVSSRRESGGVVVSVEDNGEGIPAAHLPRLFEPFFTTRDPEEAAGLGLSSALGIVQTHGGEIRVDSEPGKGSRFEVRLPLPASDAGAGEARRSGWGRALVIDDESEILSLLSRALRRQGFEVDEAANAAEALAAVEKSAYDVALCDYRMPEMDGRMLYEALCERRPEMAERFLFSTGEILSPELRSFAEARRIPVLLKPFDLQDVVKAVCSRLGRPEPAGAPPSA